MDDDERQRRMTDEVTAHLQAGLARHQERKQRYGAEQAGQLAKVELVAGAASLLLPRSGGGLFGAVAGAVAGAIARNPEWLVRPQPAAPDVIDVDFTVEPCPDSTALVVAGSRAVTVRRRRTKKRPARRR